LVAWLCVNFSFLQVPAAVSAAQDAAEQQPLAKWVTRPDGGLELQTGHAVKDLAWHVRGDYFASVAPTGNTQVRLNVLEGGSADMFPPKKEKVARASKSLSPLATPSTVTMQGCMCRGGGGGVDDQSSLFSGSRWLLPFFFPALFSGSLTVTVCINASCVVVLLDSACALHACELVDVGQ
jgi:hypothetical protein